MVVRNCPLVLPLICLSCIKIEFDSVGVCKRREIEFDSLVCTSWSCEVVLVLPWGFDSETANAYNEVIECEEIGCGKWN